MSISSDEVKASTREATMAELQMTSLFDCLKARALCLMPKESFSWELCATNSLSSESGIGSVPESKESE